MSILMKQDTPVLPASKFRGVGATTMLVAIVLLAFGLIPVSSLADYGPGERLGDCSADVRPVTGTACHNP
ncbi:MAG: hypothetical protein WBA67_18650 [Jannaschia sp.]